MASDAQRKGDALETAVEMIETAILRENASLAGRDLCIKPKKIVERDGVRHEIDLWVEMTSSDGYDALFIFECKNWAQKVGKNEVIIFAEKIDATEAQRGFIVAPAFTEDAVNQARKSKRIKLLRVRELSNGELPTIITHLHGITNTPLRLSVSMEKWIPSITKVDTFYGAEVQVAGERTKAIPYFEKWAYASLHGSLRGFGSAILLRCTSASIRRN